MIDPAAAVVAEAPLTAWVSWRAGGMAETQVGVRSTAYKDGWCVPQGVVPDEWVESTEPITRPSAAVREGERERALAAGWAQARSCLHIGMAAHPAERNVVESIVLAALASLAAPEGTEQ